MIARYDRAAKRFTAFGESLADVEAYIRGTKPQWGGGAYEASRTNPATDRWDLSVGWTGALTLARNGWGEGARELHGLLSTADIHNKKAPIEQWGMAGYAPDVGRYLAGDPAHMRRRSRSPEITHKPVVSIVYNIVANQNVGAKALALMGSAMAAIVDQLENKGRRVDLVAGFSTTTSGRIITGWQVKRAEEHLDLAAVAFAIAHPAAMRRICLALCERSPFELRSSDYGRATSLRPGDLPGADPDALYVQGMSTAYGYAPGSVLGAVDYLAKQINEAAGFQLIETKVTL